MLLVSSCVSPWILSCNPVDPAFVDGGMEKKSRSKVNIGVKASCDYAPAMLSSSRDMILTGRCDGPKKEQSLREDQRTVPYVCFVLLDLVASCEDL